MGMLLYVCPECGRWQDASALEYLGKQLTEQQQKEPLAVACPNGCGSMTHVKPEDRLVVTPIEIIERVKQRVKEKMTAKELSEVAFKRLMYGDWVSEDETT